MTFIRRKSTQSIEELEDRRMLASISQVGYFETWNGGIIPSTDAAGITYQPNSGHLYLADSEINETPEFQGSNIFEISPTGDQLYLGIPSGNDEPTGITYNEFDGYFYVTNDNTQLLTRYDTSISTGPLATHNISFDVPTAVDPEGLTSDPATGFLYIIIGIGGGNDVLAFDSNLTYQYRFSVADHMQDAEGIAFNPINHHLFIVSDPDNTIFEYTLNGIYVDEYNIKTLNPPPQSPQGLTFAPTSDPFDDPSSLSLYMADAGVDNYPDGSIYELVVSGGQLPQNSAPLVETGGDSTILVNSFPHNVFLEAAVADDGLPLLPGSVTTNWSQISGPANVTFGDPTAVDTTADFTVPGTYVLRLTANDGQLITTQDKQIVLVGGVESSIATGADDAEERTASGAMRLATGDIDMITDSGSTSSYDQIVGLRFNGLNIPQGASIQNAYVQFRADESTSVPTFLSIEGEATDDAPTFINSRYNISSRARTSASVPWTPAPWTRADEGPDQRTPDITSIVQEIVSRPGWASGQSLAIIISGTGERVAESFEGDYSAKAALLHVEYSTAGVLITPSGGATAVTEGGVSDDYAVVLTSVPTADVTITVTPDAQLDLGAGTGVPLVLTFTPANALTPQTVTVTAVDDAVVEGPHTGTITHTASSTDSVYQGLAVADVTADITDNDTAGVLITPSGGATAVTEGGVSDDYAVVLTSVPTADVTITVTPDAQLDLGAGTGVPLVLTFTPANALTPQTVTVTAVDDAVVEGPHTGTITHTASSTDSVYQGLAVADVTADITDNDTAGVLITPSGGATAVTEGGVSDDYAVVLTSVPTADVTITVTPDAQLDLGAGTGVPLVLTFTPANALTPQTVTVTAVDDAVVEGPHTGTITHTASSTDSVYQGLAVADVTADITDNDTAGVLITPSGGATTVRRAESATTMPWCSLPCPPPMSPSQSPPMRSLTSAPERVCR